MSSKLKTTFYPLPEPACQPDQLGNYPLDCAAGEKLAHEILALLQSGEHPCIIGWVITDLIRHGYPEKANGVIVGFCRALAVVLSNAVHAA